MVCYSKEIQRFHRKTLPVETRSLVGRASRSIESHPIDLKAHHLRDA